MASRYDAVVVGASLGGCTAATLLGRQGARVALVERHSDPQAFKCVCSHFIQSSAVPTLERLGLLEEIERCGGIRSRMRIWTRWGWIAPSPEPTVPASVNLRRERLDPLVREMAAQTPGVDLILGETVDRLLSEDGEVRGVDAVDRSGRRRELRARLVIGADGRDSRVAKLAEARPKTWLHGRFAYGAYFEGPAPVAPGLALVGDAALATDPLWGVGCGWAFQSAEWLADSVAPALHGEEPLSRGLRRYRRRFGKALGAHAAMIHDYADGRRLNP